MKQPEKEIFKKHAKLVCDFVNAKTTDDILISYIQNLQSVFTLSSNFKEKISIKYPTMQAVIGSLSEDEKNLFHLFLERDKIFKLCQLGLRYKGKFNLNYSGKYNLEKYEFDYDYNSKEPYDFSFTFSETDYDEHGNQLSYPCEVSIREMEKYIDDCDLVYSNLSKDELKQQMMKLFEVCWLIEEKKRDTSTFNKIDDIVKSNPDIYRIHNDIKEKQEKLKSILLRIIETDKAYQEQGFCEFLSSYMSTSGVRYVVSEENKFIKIKEFTEDYFLKRTFDSEYFFLNPPISYCLIEYLKNPEYCGKERLTICQKCHCIFSKSRLNGQQKYCPVCSRKNKMTPEERASYQKGYRANPIVIKRKREKRIKEIMRKTGRTRKEVEESLED